MNIRHHLQLISISIHDFGHGAQNIYSRIQISCFLFAMVCLLTKMRLKLKKAKHLMKGFLIIFVHLSGITSTILIKALLM